MTRIVFQVAVSEGVTLNYDRDVDGYWSIRIGSRLVVVRDGLLEVNAIQGNVVANEVLLRIPATAEA